MAIKDQDVQRVVIAASSIPPAAGNYHEPNFVMNTRAQMLRGLISFFDSIGVRDQPELARWAAQAEFRRSFEGRVGGLGPAVFQWLVMRQAVDTVKPDVHVRRFAEVAVGRALNDKDVIAVVSNAAGRLGIKAYELDWAIWEYSRSRPR